LHDASTDRTYRERELLALDQQRVPRLEVVLAHDADDQTG
jgi:hypothetical protein